MKLDIKTWQWTIIKLCNDIVTNENNFETVEEHLAVDNPEEKKQSYSCVDCIKSFNHLDVLKRH